MGRLISKLPLIVTECCKMNRQYLVGDSKYVVICDAAILGHVLRRMRIAPNALLWGGSLATYSQLSPQPPESCKVNRQSRSVNVMLSNITFLSFLLFLMCHSIHVAVNTWLTAVFYINICCFVIIHRNADKTCIII